MAYCMLQSIRLLADASRSFTDHCVVGIRADEARIRDIDGALADAGDRARAENRLRQGGARSRRQRTATARRCARKRVRAGYVTAAEFDRLVRPEKMVRPGAAK